ncbi:MULTISPECIES: serine hydrolase domain-containing protein [unclassified Kitasatospora]|uniref:serine hydrolase domain-containing protein n=1 Tax=unclassified Kitasatospora TaxID=2633591 RepID=UPI00381632DC
MTTTTSRRRLGLRLAAVAIAGATVVPLVPTAAMAAGTSAPGPSAPGPSTPAADERRPSVDLRPELEALVEQGGSTSALVEVRDHGRPLWRGAAGSADLTTGEPARADGRFRIGSVTKTFVSTVVLQLVADGRVGLDDPVERHLPGVVPNGAGITVRQLLNHTSGLFDYLEDPRFLYHDDASLRTYLAQGRWTDYRPRQLVAAGFEHPPYFAPGQGWHYSNTNYVLLGMLIGKTTGRTWQKEVEQRIIRPLHLDDTVMPTSGTGIPGPHAHGYAKLPEGPVDMTRINPTFGDAAGNGISSTNDLTRFHAALLGGRLLPPAQLAEMTTTVPAPAIGADYGLGLIRFDLPCGPAWGHLGGLPGYGTVLLGSLDGGKQFALSHTPYGEGDPEGPGRAFQNLVIKAACGKDAPPTGTFPPALTAPDTLR